MIFNAVHSASPLYALTLDREQSVDEKFKTVFPEDFEFNMQIRQKVMTHCLPILEEFCNDKKKLNSFTLLHTDRVKQLTADESICYTLQLTIRKCMRATSLKESAICRIKNVLEMTSTLQSSEELASAYAEFANNEKLFIKHVRIFFTGLVSEQLKNKFGELLKNLLLIHIDFDEFLSIIKDYKPLRAVDRLIYLVNLNEESTLKEIKVFTAKTLLKLIYLADFNETRIPDEDIKFIRQLFLEILIRTTSSRTRYLLKYLINRKFKFILDFFRNALNRGLENHCIGLKFKELLD